MKKHNTYKCDGVVLKPFCYTSEPCGISSSWNEKGVGTLILDTNCNTIDVDIVSGPAPYYADVILFLLADKDVRLMIRSYQQEKRSELFSVRISYGNLCRRDIYINYYNKYGLQTGGKRLLYVSCYGKLNKGWNKMWVGDFVEMVPHILGESTMSRLNDPGYIRHFSECHYIKGYFDDSATRSVSKII